MIQNTFKKYQREPRTQLTEELFSSGMSFTTAPLPEKYVKELVNYDIKGNGEVLTPRPGFNAVATTNTTVNIAYSDTRSIIAGQVCNDNDMGAVAQIILCDTERDVTLDSYMTQGYLTLVTVKSDHTSVANELPKHTTLVSQSGVRVNVKYPGLTQIHGMRAEPTKGLGTIALMPTGTFAFNNSYYTFGLDNHEGETYLYHTVLNKSNNAVDQLYYAEKIKAKRLTPKEAVMWGYNMLATNPYEFTCDTSAGAITLLGILPYDDNGKLIMTPRANQTLNLRCYYAAPANAHYKVVWEYKEVIASVWNEIQSSEIDIATTPTPFTAKFSSPVSQVMVRLSCYKKVENAWLPEQVMTVGFNFSKDDYGSTANVENKIYNIKDSTGMTYWKNRLIVYGVKADPSILFMSEVNDPSYFPYPNGVDLFDEPILYATPFLDNLLVFTATKLYMLVLGQDGLTWTKKLIQTNLKISEWDIHLIQVVKNMVFFKSGNYYFMVVPRLNSLTGELTIAPISTNILGLLDNFKQNVENTLEILYNYSDGIKLLHYYNYLDYEDIHNVYVFQAKDGRIFNYTLLYNSISRHWRIYINESGSIVHPLTQDATQKGVLMSLFKNSSNALSIQFHKYTLDVLKDSYVGQTSAVFRNYQYLDTGYKDHNSDYKKRYRELQFKLNNTSAKQLRFFTEFLIDGELRKGFTKYTPVHNVDKTSPNYGELTLEREFLDPSILPSATILAENKKDTNCWVLDSSLFPEAILWKIRIPVSGKGYAPRIRLVSFNEENYELLNVSWVFRSLYSR